jgi:hypothetical protein
MALGESEEARVNVPIYWLTNHDNIDAIGPWDTGLLRHLFEGRLGDVGIDFDTTWQNARHIEPCDVAVVVLPARHHYSDEDVDWLNEELAKVRAAVLILCGDEDAGFPWKRIVHQNIRWWVQMPDPKHYVDMQEWAFFFGNGWRYEYRDWIANNPTFEERAYSWGFAGQGTNAARRRAIQGLRRAAVRVPGVLAETAGFAQGIAPEAYAAQMANTWIAPCPGGPVSVDTFRLYEALEAGCIPLVDRHSATAVWSPYWEMVYGNMPFPAVPDWDAVGGIIEDVLPDRHRWAALCSSWWQQRKYELVSRLRADLIACGAPSSPPRVTAIITTSPVPSNPSLDIIAETLASIPENFEVVIAADGVRPEQDYLAQSYYDFVYRLCALAQRQPRRVTVHFDGVWRHQAGTTAAALDLVDTPVILFLEHDTPLVLDEVIDWDACVELVAEGHLDVLRFHHEAQVLDVHRRLMLDRVTTSMLGVPLRRTVQWSQRPHLAGTDYYRTILADYFPRSARTMIEDRMHSVAQSEKGHRLALYHPEGNIKRSYHLDARGDESKFDMRFA